MISARLSEEETIPRTAARPLERVAVFGHRNPDTDSVCSAIAYARLKNAVDPSRQYTAYRAGKLSDETSFALRTFGIPAPELIENVKTRLRDIDIPLAPGISADACLRDAWSVLRGQTFATLPVTAPMGEGRDGEKLEGLISVKDIGRVYLDNNDLTLLSDAATPVGNICLVLDAALLVGDRSRKLTGGQVRIAAAEGELLERYTEPGDIVIVADREDLQTIAINKGAQCLILTVGASLSASVRDIAVKSGCTVLSTGLDTYSTARLLNQSIPVRFAMIDQGIISFTPDSYLSDIRDVMTRMRPRNYPVLEEDGRYVGMISRRHLLDAYRRKVILVDHNEKSQTVAGIEEASILEILDHHRISPVETVDPVYFRNQPLGSTCTIVCQIYGELGVEIPKSTAGALLSGIVSDTLLFRSPTTTSFDRAAGEQLARIAGVDIAAYAQSLFNAGAPDEGDIGEETLFRDFKVYQTDDRKVGIAQVNFMETESLEEAARTLAGLIDTAREKKGLDILYALLTDIPAGGSVALASGEKAAELLETAFEKPVTAGRASLPGVVSRKKQFVPELLAALQK